MTRGSQRVGICVETCVVEEIRQARNWHKYAFAVTKIRIIEICFLELCLDFISALREADYDM
jgi:hypothetical protein